MMTKLAFLIFMQIKTFFTAFLLHCRDMDIKKEKEENFFYGHENSIYFSFFHFFNSTSVHGIFIKDEKKLNCRQKGCGQLTLDSDKSPSCRWVLKTLDIFSTFSCTKL